MRQQMSYSYAVMCRSNCNAVDNVVERKLALLSQLQSQHNGKEFAQGTCIENRIRSRTCCKSGALVVAAIIKGMFIQAAS